MRDLALGRETHDVDVASAARPEEVEAEFERTVPLGRAFGTMLIHVDGMDVEHTTFRSESGYSDARRPDVVSFGKSPEEDATRRDFTCNALYLDPLGGELLDPTGGMADLEAGRLQCVGDPCARFREDGLRIVRLARFAGMLELEPTRETRDAAHKELDALRGVSPERVRVELERLFERGGIVRAVRVLAETGALSRILPGVSEAAGDVEGVVRLFGKLPDPPGERLGFATLLRPIGSDGGALDEAEARLEGLRPSRAVRDHVVDVWRLEREVRGAEATARSVRVRWMMRPAFEDALRLAKAGVEVVGGDLRRFEELAEERAEILARGVVEEFVTAADLLERGVRPGLMFGVILREAQTMQMDGVVGTREAALEWLERRVRQEKPRAE